ncbi:TIGR03617 family F420-dependent LLM class oxidoreductase [Nocardia goodfellowii]|uniref:F420-dependent oxidoreductase n=1 Tax=Nocardia goodfellowii TaxID=882446 RepID=A0ABS4QRM9_9NOCA|nr:TIGR03617 family F420-dependent LLM class oxidoreductase [Nocardia goodfellowii]MBP2194350.1 putative F420-dependent oxidoreductase [Nocardia goodfellowii]
MSYQVHVQLDAAPGEAARRATDLAACGIDGLFTFEGQHDVFFPLLMAAQAVDLALFTNVAIALPRSPLHLAHSAYDLQTVSGGRFRLGLGSQVRAHIERRYGATWSRPAARMRDTVRAVKAIFEAWEGNSRLDYRGEFTSHTLMSPYFDPGPNPYGPPPIQLGALGPVMTTAAAAVADGLLVMPFNSKRHFEERTLPAVERGLAESGRTPGDFEIIPQVIVATGRDDAELAAATTGVRRLVAFYASTPNYVPVLEVEGWQDKQPTLAAMARRGAFPDMSALIDDRMLHTLAVVGTPAECAARIRDRFGSHATQICCYFPGYDISPANLTELVAALHA